MIGQKRKRLLKKSSEQENEAQEGEDAGDENLNGIPSKRKRTLDDDEID